TTLTLPSEFQMSRRPALPSGAMSRLATFCCAGALSVDVEGPAVPVGFTESAVPTVGETAVRFRTTAVTPVAGMVWPLPGSRYPATLRVTTPPGPSGPPAQFTQEPDLVSRMRNGVTG